jgi:hypothetical protein
MNAQTATVAPMAPATDARAPMIGILRLLLLVEAGAALALTIFLSMAAPAARDFLGGDLGRGTEVTLRFAAGAAFLFALFAAIASRGARRRRGWAWTMAAMLQVLLAIGTGVAVMTADWHPAYLVGFALAAGVMLVLSTAPVRRALHKA